MVGICPLSEEDLGTIGGSNAVIILEHSKNVYSHYLRLCLKYQRQRDLEALFGNGPPV